MSFDIEHCQRSYTTATHDDWCKTFAVELMEEVYRMRDRMWREEKRVNKLRVAIAVLATALHEDDD